MFPQKHALVQTRRHHVDVAVEEQRRSVTGTREERAVTDVPSAVAVIDQEVLRQGRGEGLDSYLNQTPGVVAQSNDGGSDVKLSIRGFGARSTFGVRDVLVLVDGVPITDADGFTRLDQIDLAAAERLEVVKGPASALYGSDGVAGAVSFTTKDPADFLRDGRSWGGRLKGAYASADEGAGATAVLAGRQGAWSGMLALGYRDAQEQETQGSDASADTDRTKANPQDVLTRSALGKLVFEPAGNNRIRLTAEYFDRDVKADVLSGIAKPPLTATRPWRTTWRACARESAT